MQMLDQVLAPQSMLILAVVMTFNRSWVSLRIFCSNSVMDIDITGPTRLRRSRKAGI
jgi:hypothetical protein